MATLKQKTAFNKVLENIELHNPKTAGALLIDSGYSLKTAREPKQVLDSKGFQELLAEIDDKEILEKFYMILRDTDKRSSLAAGIELLKLKGRYPKEESKFTSLFTSIKAITKEIPEDTKEQLESNEALKKSNYTTR